jgi:hypothetical protein
LSRNIGRESIGNQIYVCPFAPCIPKMFRGKTFARRKDALAGLELGSRFRTPCAVSVSPDEHPNASTNICSAYTCVQFPFEAYRSGAAAAPQEQPRNAGGGGGHRPGHIERRKCNPARRRGQLHVG